MDPSDKTVQASGLDFEKSPQSQQPEEISKFVATVVTSVDPNGGSSSQTKSEKTPNDIIIEFLTQKCATSPETAIKTRVISQNVFGKGASRKMINPTIYALQKKGKVGKIANENGGNPRWYLTS